MAGGGGRRQPTVADDGLCHLPIPQGDSPDVVLCPGIVGVLLVVDNLISLLGK